MGIEIGQDYPIHSRPRKQQVLDTIDDGVSRLLYYDRKEDEDLPVGAIDEMVQNGEITIDEMVEKFSEVLRKNL